MESVPFGTISIGAMKIITHDLLRLAASRGRFRSSLFFACTWGDDYLDFLSASDLDAAVAELAAEE